MADDRAPGTTAQPKVAAPASGATPEGVVEQTTETVRNVAESASELAQDTCTRSARYVRDGLDRYPEAGRYISEGTRAVSRPVEQHPLTALLIAARFCSRADGLALAFVSWSGSLNAFS